MLLALTRFRNPARFRDMTSQWLYDYSTQSKCFSAFCGFVDQLHAHRLRTGLNRAAPRFPEFNHAVIAQLASTGDVPMEASSCALLTDVKRFKVAPPEVGYIRISDYTYLYTYLYAYECVLPPVMHACVIDISSSSHTGM